MKACQNHQETLWLDVYGELDPIERSAWERHLETCTGCREERQRLLGLFDLVREETDPPQLSPKKTRALSWSIKRGLREQLANTKWWKGLLDMPNRLIPALTAVSLLIVALGWFAINKVQSPSSLQNLSSLKSEEQMIVKDLEVIDNMDFLEEMDTLRKLVQVVDNRDII
jgi:predicted anti-sigma-YlaC factor YlaD